MAMWASLQHAYSSISVVHFRVLLIIGAYTQQRNCYAIIESFGYIYYVLYVRKLGKSRGWHLPVGQ